MYLHILMYQHNGSTKFFSIIHLLLRYPEEMVWITDIAYESEYQTLIRVHSNSELQVNSTVVTRLRVRPQLSLSAPV